MPAVWPVHVPGPGAMRRQTVFCLLRFLSLLLLCVAAGATRAEGEIQVGVPRCEPSQGCEPGEAEASPETWVDDSYDFVTSRTDALAVWLDSFFGTVTSDMESADSVLRLRTEYEWNEEDGEDYKVRLRGKVDLPRLDERLSLVFSEEGEERQEVIPNSAGNDDDVGLQFRVRERRRSRLWFTVGTNSSLDFKSSVRYRYIQPIGDDWRVQYTQRFHFREGDGFGTTTRGDLDYLISRDRIVRWTNQAEYGEETDGVEWGTRLSYQLRLSEKDALSYFGAIAGETDPENLTRSYALGVRYRRNFLRPWIFFEIEPSYAWRRESVEESRSSLWLLTLRLEFLEERHNRRAQQGGDEANRRTVD